MGAEFVGFIVCATALAKSTTELPPKEIIASNFGKLATTWIAALTVYFGVCALDWVYSAIDCFFMWSFIDL